MTDMDDLREDRQGSAVLSAQKLNLYYGAAHALKDVDIDGALEIGCRCKELALTDGERRIALDDARTDAAERLDAERKRRDVQQQQALHRPGQDATL